jgi:hypothetical protein
MNLDHQALIAGLFAKNRAIYGDLRMSVTPPEPTPPVPPAAPPAVPVPAPPAPAPTPAPPADNGFPADTPWRDMQPAEQTAYWRYQAQRHEKDKNAALGQVATLEPKAKQYDALDEASKTESQREIDRLKAEIEQTRAAQAETTRTFGARLVEQRLASVAPDKGLDAAAMNRIVGDPGRFLGTDGTVNEDALQDFLALIPDRQSGKGAPDPRQFGGGRQSGKASVSGHDIYASRKGKKSPAQPG